MPASLAAIAMIALELPSRTFHLSQAHAAHVVTLVARSELRLVALGWRWLPFDGAKGALRHVGFPGWM